MTKRMRLAMFTQWWPPEPAAIVGSLGRELADRGHDVTVVTGVPNYPSGRVYPGHQRLPIRSARSGGLRLVRVPLYPSHDSSAFRRAANYLSFAASASLAGLPRVHADVAYVYHPPISTALPARLLRLLRGRPYVLHVQDLWPESVLESDVASGTTYRQVLARALDRSCQRTYRAAAHIVAISPTMKALLVERGTPEKKISVVYNWADEATFRPSPPSPECRATFADSQERLVVYAGNLGDFQALDEAIIAASSLPKSTALKLALIGDGVARPRLERLVRQLRTDRVTIHPHVSATEVLPILASADAHLVSLRDRPFLQAAIPGKTQVAMATGKFCLMAARGDAADLIAESNAGITCEPSRQHIATAMSALASMTSEALSTAGAQGRAFYERHLSMANGVDRIAAIMEDHMERSPR